MQLTSVEDNTSVQFATRKVGFKEEDHQLKVCIDFFSIRKLQIIIKFRVYFVITLCNFL